MTSQVRRAAKSDLKALSVVRNLFEKKRLTFSLFIKICLAEVRHTIHNASLRIFEAMLNARRSDSNITPNSLGVLMRKT